MIEEENDKIEDIVDSLISEPSFKDKLYYHAQYINELAQLLQQKTGNIIKNFHSEANPKKRQFSQLRDNNLG